MVVTDPPNDTYAARLAASARWLRARAPRLAAPALEPSLPVLVAAAVLSGLAFAIAVTPIGSGDYGQWLMVSRGYLGQAVPAYRELGDVPPLAPIVLAAVRVVLPDPFVALHAFAILLLAGIGVALYLLGSVALGTRWGGTMTVVAGLLVSDRFTDLFAFGGLLQVAALVFLCLAVAAFIQAERRPGEPVRWWLLGAGALALAAMTHVATGLLAVPVGLAVAGLAVLPTLARSGWDVEPVVRRLWLPVAALALVGLYWLVALVPASGEYVTNPASIAYRGPDRLFADLFTRWPNTVVLVVGGVSLALGAGRAIVTRRVDGYLLVGAWAALVWGALAYSIVSGSATDFPRFATPLLAPLVVGAAGGALWVLGALARSAGEVGGRQPAELIVAVAVVGLVVVAAPLTIERHMRQADFYELRDASALEAAAAWIDESIPAGQSVLSEARDGKWIEGLTGRAALFSQPVRYSFRPDEWQRGTDADSLLRATSTLTSGFVAAHFTSRAGTGADAVPTGLLIRANHGGEFVDLLRVASGTVATVDGTVLPVGSLVPLRVTEDETDRQVSVRTVWGRSGDPDFAYTQTVATYIEGTTLRLTQVAPGTTLTTDLAPTFGMSITSLEFDGTEATVCFTELGGSAPCVLIHAVEPGSRLVATTGGGVRAEGSPGGRIDLLVTALTAGDASIGLGLLDPSDLVAAHNVGAALLYEPDPAYDARLARLGEVGFIEARAFGPYRVLVRGAAAP